MQQRAFAAARANCSVMPRRQTRETRWRVVPAYNSLQQQHLLESAALTFRHSAWRVSAGYQPSLWRAALRAIRALLHDNCRDLQTMTARVAPPTFARVALLCRDSAWQALLSRRPGMLIYCCRDALLRVTRGCRLALGTYHLNNCARSTRGASPRLACHTSCSSRCYSA